MHHKEKLMKAKMLVPYRHTWLFVSGTVALLLFLGAMAYLCIRDNNGVYAFLLLLLAVIPPLALTFRLNYGIRINQKWVIAIEQSAVKIIPYDEVRRITVRFTDQSVTALIKMMDNSEVFFVWDQVFLGYDALLLDRCAYNKVDLYEEFIQKSIASLSVCEKAVMQDCRKTKLRT
jgi:hypothetical protein